MRSEIKLIDTIRVPAPCSASWEEMQGTEQKRFCEGCGLHVHNLSAMTRRDAESLLQENPDHLCVRYGQRSDSSVVTDNCPPRLRPARALLLRRYAAIASFGLLLCNLTARTVEAMQRTHQKAAGSKAPAKHTPSKTQMKAEIKKQGDTVHTVGKPSVRTFILGRRIMPSRATSADSLTGKPTSGQTNQLPVPGAGHPSNAIKGKSPLPASGKTQAVQEPETIVLGGIGSRF